MDDQNQKTTDDVVEEVRLEIMPEEFRDFYSSEPDKLSLPLVEVPRDLLKKFLFYHEFNHHVDEIINDVAEVVFYCNEHSVSLLMDFGLRAIDSEGFNVFMRDCFFASTIVININDYGDRILSEMIDYQTIFLNIYGSLIPVKTEFEKEIARLRDDFIPDLRNLMAEMKTAYDQAVAEGRIFIDGVEDQLESEKQADDVVEIPENTPDDVESELTAENQAEEATKGDLDDVEVQPAPEDFSDK